jgi:glycosyltransferase involved in cell wall biosynthesis
MVKPMGSPISVVMPAYNTEKYIGEAIESIRKQTHQDFEFIILDDGSTDRTAEIINSYIRIDSRIKFIRSDHRGVSYTINLGVELAKYDWIAIMHADDVALPHRLEKQIIAAELNPHVVAWGSYSYHINQNGKILGLAKSGVSTEEEFLEQVSKGRLIQLIHPTALIRKQALLSVGGYDPSFLACEDLELFDRLSTLGPVLALPKVLVLYRIHGSSNTMQRFFEARAFTRYIRERQRARLKGLKLYAWDEFKTEYDAAPAMKKLRRQIDDMSQFYYRKFAVSISIGEYLRAIEFFALSAVLNPRYAIPRAWNQRFSKRARRSLEAAKIQQGEARDND